MSFNQALQKLKDERILYTSMLDPLNLSFEFFLRMGQLNDKGTDRVVTKLIAYLENKKDVRQCTT
jgi:hypothetical protein